MLLTLKSTDDSRFSMSPSVDNSVWRRRLTAGAQRGLAMEFFDEARADELISAFKVSKKHHLISRDFSTELVTADWVFVLEA